MPNARRHRPRLEVYVCLLVLAACGDAARDRTAVSQLELVEAPRACVKDALLIRNILDEVVTRPHCQTPSECPCGMACNEDGFCDATCIATNDPACAGGAQCDNWGQCRVPADAGAPVTELPVLHVDPVALTVPHPASGQPYATSQVTVLLDTTSAQIANQVARHPSVKVRGSIAPPPGCTDTSTATECQLDRTPELEVSCSPTGAFADECTLTPPWSFVAVTGGFEAARVVRVRPKTGAHEGTWELRVLSDGASRSPEHVSIQDHVSVPQPRAGRYKGTVELEDGAATPALHFGIEAYASDAALLIVDPTHLLSPSGLVHLDAAPGHHVVTWLGTDAQPLVAADIAVVQLDHDPDLGRLSGAFTVRLPGANAAGRGLLTWRFALTRAAALAGPACTSDGDTACTNGHVCDVALASCVPGPAWHELTSADPFSAISHPAASIDGLALLGTTGLGVSLRPTADAVERLFCYATTDAAPFRDLVLGSAVMANTGDLACANGVKPRHDTLAILPDAGSTLSEGALLAQCLTELALPGTSLASTQCIGLGRIYPAIALLLRADRGTDRRSALLLQSTLRQWLVTHAFVAHDALESYRLDLADDGQAQSPPEPMLDRIAAGWSLLLDGSVQGALESLPPETLRAPDYRGSNRPYVYYPWNGTNGYSSFDDAENHVELSACSWMYPQDGTVACAQAANADGKLDRDLTVAFRAGYDELALRGTRLFESPWLNIAWETPWDTYYQRDYKRPTPVAALYTAVGLPWTSCVQWCASWGSCLAWSWQTSTSTCQIHYAASDLTASAPAPGWRTGLVRSTAENSQNGSAYSATFEDGYDFYGGDYASSTQPTAQACQAQCTAASTNCVAWSWAKNGHGCWLKGRGSNNSQDRPLPLKIPNAEVVGGYSRMGAQEYQGINQFDDDTWYAGYDYRSFAAPYFDSCIDACMNEAQCKVWSWSKSGQYCYLKTDGGTTERIPNKYMVSGHKPSLSLVVAHRGASGRSTPVRFKLADRPVYPDASFTIVRSVAERKYRLYRDQPCDAAHKCTTLLGEAPFAEVPYAPGAGTWALGRGTWPGAFARVLGFAVFPTALDDLEIDAMEQRRLGGDGDPATRTGPLVLPANPSHEQGLGLPVTMLETAESELDLVSQVVDSHQGQVAEECDAGALTPTRDGLIARVADTLRRDALVEALAERLHDRATTVACHTQDTCTPLGATCGAPQTVIHVPATSMTVSGTMQTGCYVGYWSEMTGLCAPGGSGDVLSVAAAGTVGSANATFTVDRPGAYTVWASMVGRSVQARSFWIRLDRGAWSAIATVPYPSTSLESEWIWQRVSLLGMPVLTAGPHSIDIAVREDGTFLREIVLTSDAAHGPGVPVDDVCRDASGVAITQATPWSDRYGKARTSFRAARARLVQTSADLTACKNPLAITAEDLPLYFRDPFGNSNRYFASSDYLMSLVDGPTGALARATGFYDAALTAWKHQRDDAMQQVLDTNQAETRRDAIAQQYEAPIADLCGVAQGQPGALLDQFTSGALRSDNCFVSPTSTCMANFNGPISQATAGCYRGLTGEALLAMKAASNRVDQGRQIWNAKQGEYEAQSAYCVGLEENQTLVQKHYEALRALRAEKAVWDQVSRYIGFAAAISGVGVAGIVTSHNLGSGSGTGDLLNGASVIGGIVSGGLNLLGAHAQDQIDAENQAYEQEMAARGAAQAVQLCFNQAAALHDAIASAQLDMQHATIEFEEATLRFADGRRKLDDLVAQGQGAVTREQDRLVVRPQFHYWLNSTVASYQAELVWARRLAYMALLAVEYDFQTHLDLRRKILDATRPSELTAALATLRQVQASYQVCGGTPQSKFVVLSLTSDVLKFTGTSSERSQRLREYLRDRAHRITDASGAVIGFGVRFALSPETKAQLADRCGERVWSTTAMITTSQTSPPRRAPVRLFKQNRFASQWCSCAGAGAEPLQSATIRPTRNLFLPSSTQSFVDSSTSSPSDIDATVNGSIDQLNTDGYTEGAVTDFAGRALYGDYVLLFRSTDTTLDLSTIDEVYLRFDYLSVADGALP